MALSFVQFCVLGWLTWYIFVRGSRLKTAERQANWYHKIVVDHSIPVLADFFKNTKEILCQCTERLPALTAPTTEREYDAEVRNTIAQFSENLRLLTDDLSGRLSFFDGNATQRFLARADQFEDEITDWFGAYKKARQFDGRDSLPTLFVNCQNELLGIIKGFEFDTWK